MFDFLGFLNRPTVISTICFDEAYCHSAGDEGRKIYGIRKGTTEIVFRFDDFDGFLDTYLFRHPYLPDLVKRSVQDGSGTFCAQVVQNAAYVCKAGVQSDGCIRFSSETLQPLRPFKRLRTFTRGAIAFGVLRPNDGFFSVLWATMYEDRDEPSPGRP